MNTIALVSLGYRLEKNYPIIYVKGNDIVNNIYMENSHPSDKQNTYFRGQSRGRVRALEQAGWVGYTKRDIDYNTN